MSGWYGTKIGLKTESSQKEVAKQFLQIIGANTYEINMYEEIHVLSGEYTPSVQGEVEGDLLGIMRSLEKHFVEYQDVSYDFEYEEESDLDDDESDEESDSDDEESDEESNDNYCLDSLFNLTNKLFSPAYLYLAHEDGNSVSDSYYRYEVIFDPTSRKKKVYECYYSYGDGINEGQECDINEESIDCAEFDNMIIDALIKKAEVKEYYELAKKLVMCKQ